MKLMNLEFSAACGASKRRFAPVQLAWLICVIVLAGGTAVLAAADNAAPTNEAAGGKKTELPIPKEESSITTNKVKIGDQTISYTATAGNLLIRKGDDPVASMFYVAYTRDGVTNLQQRPVTFFY